MAEEPKLKIFNRDGTVTEVTPNKMWSPCTGDAFGRCTICGEKMGTMVHQHSDSRDKL
jgi:hypothetical protein